MSERDDLFRKFGPILIEALMLMILKAVNDLRGQAGLLPYTQQQLMSEIDNRLSTLQPYEWMGRG